jgi:peptidoglycan/LPS O-acetylase OafA/YrhL
VVAPLGKWRAERARRRLVMEVGGIVLLVVVAAALGAGAQFIPGYPGPRTRFDGVIVGVVALAAEFLANALRHFGPQWQGVYVVPTIIVGAIWAIISTVALRRLGRKMPEPVD